MSSPDLGRIAADYRTMFGEYAGSSQSAFIDGWEAVYFGKQKEYIQSDLQEQIGKLLSKGPAKHSLANYPEQFARITGMLYAAADIMPFHTVDYDVARMFVELASRQPGFNAEPLRQRITGIEQRLELPSAR